MPLVLCVPFAPILAHSRKNCEALLRLAGQIAGMDTKPDLVVLPELALSGYLLESLTGDAALTLVELENFAQDLVQTGVPAHTEWVLGLPLREGNDVFNCAAVLAAGKVRHLHRKLFLPTYGMFDEERYFSRGQNLELYNGVLGKTAILVCEDAWHLELAYAASLKRADSVIVISASPARGLKSTPGFASSAHWANRLQICAESYGQSYIYCNRGGVEDGVLYDASNFALSHAAEFVSAQFSGLYDGASSYQLTSKHETRVGFIGNSSRQNDAALVKAILSDAVS